jgi:hypothetical protein
MLAIVLSKREGSKRIFVNPMSHMSVFKLLKNNITNDWKSNQDAKIALENNGNECVEGRLDLECKPK